MIFVFDLDDTVCDTDAYSEQYILNFIKDNNLPYKQIAKNVRFAEQKFDWSREYALSWYKKYGDAMMFNFPCKEGAVELINQLYDLNHTIIIATARANDWHNEPERITKEWLDKEGIKYHKLYIGRIDKEKICEEENANFFIDDDIKITKNVAEYFVSQNNKNVQCFIMNTGYNKDLEINECVKRVNSFNEFKTELMKYNIFNK